MSHLTHPIAKRISEATLAVFGQSPLAIQVQRACEHFEQEVANIELGRGIQALIIAIVGAKGQGKTWTARQLVLNHAIRERMRSGDLKDDATTKLVWIGPVAPDRLNLTSEIFHPCPSNEMFDLGQPLVILDTPGVTDADPQAAQLARESLSLAPIKLLIIARDQLRAAANLTLARQIDGAICVPIITSVEEPSQDVKLQHDLQSLRQQLSIMAPSSSLTREVLLPDFEITGDEEAAARILRSHLKDRLNELGVTQGSLRSSEEHRLVSATGRLRSTVTRIISQEIPQLAKAVEHLHRETNLLPSRVIDSMLGSQHILETGIRMRLRARLVTDTSLMFFPYRTVLSILNLTHGAWDRIILALGGSIPSLFGALTGWARNVKQSQSISNEIHDGLRMRTQQQVEERLQPLCDQFHREVMQLRPREQREHDRAPGLTKVRLLGIDHLQDQSSTIFEEAVDQNAIGSWITTPLAVFGMIIFWAMMCSPIITLYRDYFHASWQVWTGDSHVHLDEFPHPSYGLFFTSVLLSTLPLLIYCMLVLTLSLSRHRIGRIARGVVLKHKAVIEQLQQSQVIRLQFGDEMLQQAEYLLSLR